MADSCERDMNQEKVKDKWGGVWGKWLLSIEGWIMCCEWQSSRLQI